MRNVAFKEEEFQMVQVLLQNHLDDLTENEFFEHSQDTHQVKQKENVCMSAITAMRHPIAEEVWEIHQTLPDDKQLDRDSFMKKFYSTYTSEYYDSVELVSD